MDTEFKTLSYKEYIYTCRRVIERCTAFETKGELWDHGISLAIDFGVEDIWIKIMLVYDPSTHYWKPSLKLFVELDYKDDENTWKGLGVINRLRQTMLELADAFSDFRIDYMAALEAGDFKQYEWDLRS